MHAAKNLHGTHAAWGTENFLQAVTDVAPNLIYVFNHETMANEYTNRSLGEMLGYSAAEIAGMGGELMAKLIHPADLPRVVANFDVIKALKNEDVTRIEYRAKHKKGFWVWLLSSDTVFSRNAKGEVTRHLGTAVDISAQKKAIAEAQRAEQQASAANDELRAFAYAISHDLKAPSNTLGMILSELRQTAQDRLLADDLDLISMADATVARMGRVIEDVLAYTRVIGKKFEFEALELDAILDDAIGNLRADISESGVKISRDPLPVILGSGSQLRILFQNLISNAIKFRKMEDDAPEVCITCFTADGVARITVKDNGIGIPKEKHEEVFRIFKRLHAHDDIQGQGLGLSICQRIASNHRSQIDLESSAGNGASFTIRLPLV